jgi:hypothetical protein
MHSSISLSPLSTKAGLDNDDEAGGEVKGEKKKK